MDVRAAAVKLQMPPLQREQFRGRDERDRLDGWRDSADLRNLRALADAATTLAEYDEWLEEVWPS